jgi:hypothetical protein
MKSRGIFVSVISKLDVEFEGVFTTMKLSLEVLGDSVVCDMYSFVCCYPHVTDLDVYVQQCNSTDGEGTFPYLAVR